MQQKPDLSQFPFFSDISREYLEEIEAFSHIKTYEKGDIIFQSQEPAEHLYGLMQGDVDLLILFTDKILTKDIKYEEFISTQVKNVEKQVKIDEIKQNEVFGWSAFVEPGKMTSTACCAQASQIALIPADKLKSLCGNDPELGYLLSTRISAIIAQRLNSRTQKLVRTWCELYEADCIRSV